MATRKIKLLNTQYAQRALQLSGKPYSLQDYPYAVDIINRRAPELVLKTGRQIGKSTLLVVLALLECMSHPHWGSLFIAPTKGQTTTWSAMRLGRMIRHSPYVMEKFVSTKLSMGVWRKEFTNGSYVISTYAYDDGDRARGNSADRIFYDEAQDIGLEEVLPVVNEAAANSEYGYITYSGTPKSMENNIEVIHSTSTQREWVMPCSACGSWQFVSSIKSIGKTGLVCVKPGCHGRLNPREGHWHAMNLRTGLDPGEHQVEGYHIPQVILPRNVESVERWGRIRKKLEDYGESAFLNEVLGMSVAMGGRLLTEDLLRSRCRDYAVSDIPPAGIFDDILVDVSGQLEIYAGIDWGGEGKKGNSFTAIWIFGVLPGGLFKTIHYKLYPTGNPVGAVEDIARLLTAFRVKLAGGDAGGGALANATLAMHLGAHKIVQFQYGSFQSLVTQAVDRFHLDRTGAIDSWMMQIRHGGVFFPHEEQSKRTFPHLLAVFEEITQDGRGKKIWNKSPGKPDDLLHAQVFAFFAAGVGRGTFGFYELPSLLASPEARMAA